MTKFKVVLLIIGGLCIVCFSFYCLPPKGYQVKNKTPKAAASKNNSLHNFPKGIDPDEYIFCFSDEFNGTTIDENIWNRRRRLATDTNSIDPNSLETIKVSNGILSMATYTAPNKIGSAEISTDKHYQLRYGYFELKAQLSSGVGNGSAFWLQTPKTLVVSNPFNPAMAGVEVDIFENGISNGINKIYYSLHWNG